MPLEIRAIQERRAQLSFPFAGGTVELDYYAVRADALTQADLDRLRDECAGKPAGEQRRTFAAFLLRLVAAWDVTSDGAPYPLTVDALAALDDRFLAVCVAAILEHANTGKVSGLPLSALGIATSSPRDDAASSPAARANRASRRSAKSPRSPSNAGSRRGNSPSIPSGSPS